MDQARRKTSPTPPRTIPRWLWSVCVSLVLLPSLGLAQKGRSLSPEHREQLSELQPKINSAIDKGVAWLLSAQLRDGSWDHESVHFPTGMTALATYTLLKSGLPPSHPALRRAIANLMARRPNRVYAASCNLLALAATHDRAYHAHMKKILDDLLEWQNGTWGYPNYDGSLPYLHADRDLSISQFAVLGFRAALASGIDVPRKAILAAFDGVQHYQERPTKVKSQGGKGTSASTREIAGFRYRFSSRGRSTGSMTTAGIAAATILGHELGRKLSRSQARALRQLTDRGLGWLDHNYTITENPHHKAWWHYYYLYGLERVGSLLGIEYIGEHPWYLDGARYLVAKQQKKGNWYTSRTMPDTCFALLFLTRATSASTGRPARNPRVTIAEDAKSPVGLRAAGGKDGSPLEIWITRIGKRASGTKYPPAVRVAKVEYLLDGKVIAEVAADSAKVWRGESLPCRHVFKTAGRYHVGALAHVLSDGPDGPVEQVWKAKGFDIVIGQVFEDWMLDATTVSLRNLLRRTERSVQASTSRRNHPANRAVDLQEGTSWRCKPGDQLPMLTIHLAKAQRANTLWLTQANAMRAHLGELDRITKVRIWFNKSKKPMEVALAHDELAPTRVPLGQTRRVKKIRIEIVERKSGRKTKGVAGFAEVGLLLEKEKKR